MSTALSLLRPLPCRCLRQAARAYATAVKTPRQRGGNVVKSKAPPNTVQAPVATDDVVRVKVPAENSGQIRRYRPTTPGQRHLRRVVNDHLWKGKPIRKLTFAKKGMARGGRNNTGRITVRHRGGGHKRRIRIIDFERNVPGKHTVERIEYDPNRNAHLALLVRDGTDEKSYIVAPDGVRAGHKMESFRPGLPADLMKSMGGKIDPGVLAALTTVPGNCMPVKLIPIGTQVHNLGAKRNGKAIFCRAAGTYAAVVSKDETKKRCKEVVVRMQSGELRRVDPEACATIGIVSNPLWKYQQLGKAGRSRWLGIRPSVRGVAMNAFEHPHGGGRGKSKGNRIPVSPWGLISKSGFKTRRKSNKHKALVQDRPRMLGRKKS